MPEKQGGRIVIGEPILISRQSIGLSLHSGSPSTIVSRGSKVHVVWAEATDPAEKAPGVPTYVVTYDRRTKTLGKPALVGHGPPANDVHNTPSITMDSRATCTCWPERMGGPSLRPIAPAQRFRRRLDGARAHRRPAAADLSRPGLRPRRRAAPRLARLAIRRGAVSGQQLRHARPAAETAGRRLATAPGTDYSAPVGIQRVLPPADDRSHGAAVPLLRLLVDLTGSTARTRRGDRRVMIMSADGGRRGSWSDERPRRPASAVKATAKRPVRSSCSRPAPGRP